ncbi:MAG: hypothetical protein EP329_23625 [Deltaproteobacteria bacterium]|nr:MAG: hypothetical protein EP329_23625 [Deltaproteobacteria bacterium]
MKTLLAIVLASLTAPALAAPAPQAVAPAAATCDATPLMRALSTLRSGTTLHVVQAPGRVTVEDRAHGKVLLVATCDGLAQIGPADARRATEKQAVTEVARGTAGEVLYTHSATPLGTRVVRVEPSATDRRGLDVTAFDNDDVYVSDAFGRLLYQRQTLEDGTLVERESAAVGCGCERVTAATGVVTETRR